jgi:hypothetical protein
MKMEIRYVELKTGYSDDGPAWIGKVKLSKSGQTIYFNDKAFRKGQRLMEITMMSKQKKTIGFLELKKMVLIVIGLAMVKSFWTRT